MPCAPNHLRKLLAAPLVLALLGLFLQPLHAQALGTFPVISAQALDKTSITLPTQLQGKVNLLLLSWARDQAPQIETWNAVGQALLHSNPSMRVYRIPVSDSENFLFRWWDSASLRTDESDPDLLHWTVPIYTDKVKLRRSLQIPVNEHQILALLVDRSGRVLWRAMGPSTPANRQSLRSVAEADHAF